jgi:RNA-directed DNA polymerase
MSEAKPFCISKKEVWEAYQRVKENKGAAGIDDQSIEDFERITHAWVGAGSYA